MKHAAYALLIVVGLGLLAALNFALARRPVDISPDYSGAKVEQGTGASAQTTESNFDANFELTETLARPLFSPTRRKFVPQQVVVEEVLEPAPAELPEPPAPVAVLRPEINLQGTRRIGVAFSALVQDTADSPSKWVTVGEILHDWTVAKIDENSIVLSSGSETVTYLLYPTRTDADL